VIAPRISRRRFLRALGGGALLAALPGPLWAQAGNTVTISLLHTTDLHGHLLPTSDYHDHPDLGGLARCATQLRAWRRANPSSVLLDIGDVYQGTAVSLATRGDAMIRCLNALDYDAWVVGNHEFDWGLEALASCVQASAMPVLSGNALIDGQPVGTLDGKHPLARIRPWLIKDVAGFRLAIIGLTTPALATWLPPEDLRGFEALDPLEALGDLLRGVQAERLDAVVLAGHMGLTRRDDLANQVGELTREFPQAVVYLGGHTHQNHPGEWINGVLYTQADHYGIYAGKVDLTFDRATRRLLHREATTVLMDRQVPLDPVVLALTEKDRAAADAAQAREIGELAEPFGASSSFGNPCAQERLIASAMLESMRGRGIEVDAVIHGLFDPRRDLGAGRKTMGDVWNLLPYENQIVTFAASDVELLAIARELAGARDFRQLLGVRVVWENGAEGRQVSGLLPPRGAPGPKTYRVALNAYDAQSGGGRFPTLAQIVARAASGRTLHPVRVRDAVIDFFVARKTVSAATLPV
jgi:2',3'-cyclic-nucleotide 2'-phosphodiesterase/3'-nucleotidase